MSEISKLIMDLGKNARTASRALALSSHEQRNKALQAMADALVHHQKNIQIANDKDMAEARQKGLSNAFLDRLALNEQRIVAMAKGLTTLIDLPDPIAKILATIDRPNGLQIKRITVPIGVIGVIYESRPNVTADAAGLCLKSANAVILRGGSESYHSATAIVTALQEGLAKTDLPLSCIQMVPSADRTAVTELLKLDQYIDVIIPRGGPELIQRIAAESRIPLFKHLAGLCHTYIHQAANQEMAKRIVLNAKMRRTGICGATEVLLIDESILQSHLPPIIAALVEANCEIRGDEQVAKLFPQVKQANPTDFNTEFLDAIIAIKVVPNIATAIAHIAQHGTQHTDAIITEDHTAAQKFLTEVDSAIVMHNASTQFADGGEFGMGAEIGIATGKLHARGPVGIEQLTTFKYQVYGNGQTRA